MKTIDGSNFLGVYDVPEADTVSNWQYSALSTAYKYRAISYVVKQDPEFNRLLSQQHEFYVHSYLTSEYFRLSLQELYGEDDKLLDVITLDGDRQILSELNNNKVSTPDFLVVLKKHVMTLDAKSSPDVVDLSSNQINHNNTEQVVRSSPTLQQLIAEKIKTKKLGYVRGKFVLPERQRYIEYLSPEYWKDGYYTQRVFNLQNVQVVDEWRDAFLCPSAVLLDSLKQYVYYVEHKLGLSYNSVDYINLLTRLTVNDNLNSRIPLLKRNQEILVKTPHEQDSVVQNLTLALLSLGRDRYGNYEEIDYFFDGYSDVDSVSSLVHKLYDTQYFLSYELAAKLHPKLLRATGNLLQRKRVPTTFIPYTDATGVPHLAKLSCFGRNVPLRNIRSDIEDQVWSMFTTGTITYANYEDIINDLVLQGAEIVSQSVKDGEKNFDPANFKL